MSKYLRYLLPLVCLVVLAASCGRKASPTWSDPLQPPAVEDLRIQQRPGEVLLRWDYPDEATTVLKRFEVERSSNAAKPQTIAKTRETSYLDTGLEEGKIYTYWVVARSEAARSNKVAIVTAGGEPPPPPHDLVIQATVDSLELTWSHPAPQGLFNVYRSATPGQASFVAMGPPIRGTTTAVRLALDTPVYFAVRAVAPNTPPEVVYESAPSKEVMLDPATLVPEAPTGLRTVAMGGGAVLLWSESAEPWVRTYRIYRAGADGVFAQIGEAGTPTYTDPAPPATGGPWTYRVSAVGPGGEGPPSQSVAAPAPEPKK